MNTTMVSIEDWDGGGAVRVPDEVLQKLGVDVGDSLYVLEEYVGATLCVILSRTPRILDRTDEMFD